MPGRCRQDKSADVDVRTHRGEIEPGEAENGLKTTCHEIVYFCKTLEIRTRRGEIDPADSEFHGLATRFGPNRDFQSCNFLDKMRYFFE